MPPTDGVSDNVTSSYDKLILKVIINSSSICRKKFSHETACYELLHHTTYSHVHQSSAVQHDVDSGVVVSSN